MAIVNNGTRNLLQAGYIPTGYTRPVVTTFDDYETLSKRTLTFNKSLVENATASVTMADIVTQLETLVDAILVEDFNAAATGESYTDFLAITNNLRKVNGDDYTTAVVTYSCDVRIYTKTV